MKFCKTKLFTAYTACFCHGSCAASRRWQHPSLCSGWQRKGQALFRAPCTPLGSRAPTIRNALHGNTPCVLLYAKMQGRSVVDKYLKTSPPEARVDQLAPLVCRTLQSPASSLEDHKGWESIGYGMQQGQVAGATVEGNFVRSSFVACSPASFGQQVIIP